MTSLIVGGGVAGSAAAILLGRDATLVERTSGPHDKVCGEFLSAEALAYLRRLGLDPAALGGAPIERVRLVYGHRVAEAALPFPAMGLSRRVLDEAMLARAALAGATVLRGHAVRRIEPQAASLDGLGALPYRRLLLATGKHDLRSHRRRPRRAPEDLVGLKMHLALDPAQLRALEGTVELILLPFGYAGLQPIEGGAANLCLLLDHARFIAAGETWCGVVRLLAAHAPHLATRLEGARALLPRPLSIFRVPYGYLHRPGADDPPNLFRLGDQAVVIPSFSGDGVSLALHTAFLAAANDSAPAYHHALHRQLRGQIRRAGTLYRAGRAVPSLLAAAAAAVPQSLRYAARLTRIPGAAR